ncbi:mechanosensitive ion channel family protein [Puniceicoccaceae bacterium K14]|nr:mechanosensitive ion channel family protein [Puniceicoccaceae bacterium K14]
MKDGIDASALLDNLWPMATVVAVAGLAVFLNNRYFERRSKKLGKKQNFLKQMTLLGISVASVIALLIALPISSTVKDQLLGLFGLVVTGMIALSSTSFVSNAMSGLMIRTIGSFRSGDFIRVGEHFGRVSERGLFHTEIQTKSRELTTLPNLYLISNSVTVVRSSGVVVSTNVSLGYDTDNTVIEPLLKEAADKAGLKDVFVQVTELGDFSVVYRVAGLLEDVKQLISTRSKLNVQILDILHQANIEIMSPNVMMQRPIPDSKVLIPTSRCKPESDVCETDIPESKIFDKAEEAEHREQLEFRYEELCAQVELLETRIKKVPEERQVRLQRRIDSLNEKIATMAKELGYSSSSKS